MQGRRVAVVHNVLPTAITLTLTGHSQLHFTLNHHQDGGDGGGDGGVSSVWTVTV